MQEKICIKEELKDKVSWTSEQISSCRNTQAASVSPKRALRESQAKNSRREKQFGISLGFGKEVL